MSDAGSEPDDAYLQRLRAAKDSDAVLKSRFVAVRSATPRAAIFVFEGSDDRIVYSHWFRRLDEHLLYEPFNCEGKRGIKKLKRILARDLNALARGVYFFVDRDFDDLSDFIDTKDVFMTDRYSIENYLVEEIVLEQCLKVEFPCQGKPEIRQSVITAFTESYSRFLIETREVNRRIFYARRLGFELAAPLPTRLARLATVTLSSVQAAGYSASNLVQYTHSIDVKDAECLDAQFEALDARLRYRGKFAWLFFRRWLELLGAEWKSPQVGIFEGLESAEEARASELTLGNLASRSPLPIGLFEFMVGAGLLQPPESLG